MLLGLIATYWNLSVRKKYFEEDEQEKKAENLICTVVVWCTWLYAVTEILSLGKHLNRVSILAAWGIYFFIQLLLIVSYRRKQSFRVQTVRNERPFLHKKKSKAELVLLILFALYSLLVIGMAVQTPPYNCDSMIYHLSRIVNWAHNGSVAHFATDNWREISSTPFAEFVGLHLYLLSGGRDQMINLVQAGSNLLLVVLLFHLTRIAGGSRKGAYLAAILFATMPIAFVEANTTQNDEFAALWLVFFVYEVLRIVRHPRLLERRCGGIFRCVILFLTIGLGYLTKPTTFPAIGLFTVWMLVYLACHVRVPLSKIAAWAAATAAGALLTVLPEVGRNLITYHAVSYYGVGARQIVGTVRPGYLLINFLKNLSMNLPSIYWPNVYWRFESAIYKLANLLHVSINDPSIAETGVAFHISRAPDYGCDAAVSFVVMILILVCSISAVLRRIQKVFFPSERKKGRLSLSAGYTVMALGSFYVLLLIMRWEPYVNRYMLGYFAIAIPAVVLELERICRQFPSRSEWMHGCICGTILLLSGVEFLNMSDDLRLKTKERSEQGEISTWFETGEDKKEDYQKAAAYVKEKGYQEIGLKLDGASFEYPLLRMLEETSADYRFVNVTNETAQYEDRLFQPECIIYTGIPDEAIEKGSYQCHGTIYTKIQKISDVCYVIER